MLQLFKNYKSGIIAQGDTSLKILNFLRKPWSLKKKITFSFTTIVMAITLALSLLYYHSQSNQLMENLIRTSTNDVNYLMGNIERQLRQGEHLSDWIFVNNDIQTILIRNYDDDRARFGRDAAPVRRLISERLSASAVGRYVVFMLITGNNGEVLRSNIDAYWVDDLYEVQWFADRLSYVGGAYWSGIYENPAVYRSEDMIFPIVRPIIYSGTRIEIGWHLIAFSPNLISSVLEDFHMDEMRSVVILDHNSHVIFHQNKDMIGQASTYSFLNEIQNRNSSYIKELNGRQVLVTTRYSTPSGITILLINSLEELEAQVGFTLRILLGIAAITAVMILLLFYYLSKHLTKPLNRILNRLQTISVGNFDTDSSVVGKDEMGLIYQGINDMSANMGSLMDEVASRKHESVELEYKVLLNQINPHFVYNVLNSIKVMADIQQSEGISDMAASLGMLLKEISKSTEENITIRRELELLESYLLIQNTRRCGLLTVNYDISEELKDCLIPRFTLQPLAENAVHHGLDKKDGMGTIDISVFEEDGMIIITILDNGVGISPSRLAAILSGSVDKDKDDFSHVGLKNIKRRIELFSKNTGGLLIESVECQHTKVTVKLPRRTE